MVSFRSDASGSNPESRDAGRAPSDHPGTTRSRCLRVNAFLPIRHFAHLRDPAARNRPSGCQNVGPRKTEGTGKAGRMMHPQSRVGNENNHTSVVTTGSPERPGLPCAMVLTVSFVLSPVR